LKFRMIDLISEASTLGVLLEETRGVVGVVLGTPDGELRTVVGSFVDGDATAACAASLTEELSKVGRLLGLGELGVASLKSLTAARVFARQSDAVLAIELDPKRPLGELENKLRTLAWAPQPKDIRPEPPAVNRVPTVPSHDIHPDDRTTMPPPLPDPPSVSSVSSMPPAGRTTPVPTGIPANALPIATVRPRPQTPVPSNHAPARPMPGGSMFRPTGSTGAPTRPLSAVTPRTKPPTPPVVAGRGTPASSATIRPSAPISLPSQVKSVGAGPVFTGDLEEFSLPDLLEFLRNSHRSGLLMCSTAAGVGTIQLSRGMIISADSPNAINLREYFLNSADVPLERRRALAELPAECFTDDALASHGSAGARSTPGGSAESIDGALLARELVPPDDMERARVLRIYSAFREMIHWTVGRFSFDPGVAVVTNPGLALSAQTILMHIYQEQDEKAR
jgi:hypothetical protein